MSPPYIFRFRTRGWWVLLLALHFASPLAGQVRIVNSDAPVQSRKRGVGVNSLSDLDFRALAPGVSWYYNWGATPLAKPADVTMDFVPMAWNGAASFQTALAAHLAAGNRPWRVFALNEPNLTTQASMTPSAAATTFQQVKALCDPYDIPVIGPHMAIGTPANQSISAYDPLQRSNVTYTFQEPYLNAFRYYCGSNTPAGVASHSYGGYGEITWLLGLMHTDYPTQTVWLTEFCPWDATSDATALATLIPAVDYCERTPWVEGYAWFMARLSDNAYNSLLAGSGVLTPAGQAYLQMPVHDTNLFYHIPGRLQAERYAALNSADIIPTADGDGLADMKSTAAGGSLDYNLHVDAAGNYPLRLRVAGPAGTIRLYRGSTQLVTATTSGTGWATLSTLVPLVAGTQTLRVVLSANGQQLNWLDFLATDGTPSAPNSLTASVSGTQVVLRWLTAAGATGYTIQRASVSGGPYTVVGTSTGTSYTNSGLALGNTYYYVVSATNTVGTSAKSSQVRATTSYPPVNLALGKPASVSSVENAIYPGSNAVDGNPSTRWSSAFSDPQWLAVDLLAPYDITRVKLTWESAYGRAYQIQVSTNGTNWTSIFSTNNASGGVEDLTGLFGGGRHLRIYGTARGSPYGYSLLELEVYGTVPRPAGLTATGGLGQATLSWNASPGASGYLVKRALASGGPYATVATVTTTSYTDTGLANGTTYYYVVSALNSFSESTHSLEASALTTSPPLAPPTLTGPVLGEGRFGFWIGGNTGATYVIEASTDLRSWIPVGTNTPATLPYFWSDTNSLAAPSAFYRVRLAP